MPVVDEIDHRSDIYALGCILFELLTGAPPYDGEIEAIITAHLDAPIPRVSRFCSCTPQLDELITHLLAKDPARRFQSMTAVRRALDSIPLGRLGSSPTIVPSSQRTALPRIMRPGAASQEATAKQAPLDTTVDGVVGGVIEKVRAEPPRLARGTSAPPPLRDLPPPPIVKGRPAPRPTIAPPMGASPMGASPMGAPPIGAPPMGAPPMAAPPMGAPPVPPVAGLESARLPRVVVSDSTRLARIATAMPVAPPPPVPPSFVPPPSFAPSAATPSAGHKLPPYYPERPVLAAANVTPPTPVPMAPTMSTAMAMSMAYVPPSPSGKAPSLHHPMAIPVSLVAPARSYEHLDAFDEEPPPSRWPLVIVALACSLAGALAALVVA